MTTKKLKFYLIGIKGVGMTMLAQFLSAKGNEVCGSDIKEIFLTDKVLKSEKIKVFSPFNEKNISSDANYIVYSSAFTAENNSEMAYLKNNPGLFKNVKIISYAEALGAVFNEYKGIAVCGSHGKTTTSAWLGYVLWRAHKKPNVLVGSRVPQFKGSSLIGASKLFVAEVDEYQNKLRYFKPQGVVLNNIDYDHPDFFKTEREYLQVFIDFVKKIPKNGFLVVNNRDKYAKDIKRRCPAKIISYDLSDEISNRETVNYLAYGLRTKNNFQIFQVNNFGEFKIRLLGKHNVFNALAVIASARELGVSINLIKKHLVEFRGTERRLQYLGKYKGAIILDDYAHHPTEIKATLQGIKDHYKTKNIITVFHPHTFTRTKALFNDFVRSFKDADELIILDIYGSAREKQGGTSSRLLAKEIMSNNRRNKIKQTVINIKTIKEAAGFLRKKLNKNDLVVLMGAGDVFRVYDNLC